MNSEKVITCYTICQSLIWEKLGQSLGAKLKQHEEKHTTFKQVWISHC